MDGIHLAFQEMWTCSNAVRFELFAAHAVCSMYNYAADISLYSKLPYRFSYSVL